MFYHMFSYLKDLSLERRGNQFYSVGELITERLGCRLFLLISVTNSSVQY